MPIHNSFQELMAANTEGAQRKADAVTNNRFLSATPETVPAGTAVALGMYHPRLEGDGMVVSFDNKNTNIPFEMPIVVPLNKVVAAAQLNAEVHERGWECATITSDQIGIIQEMITAQKALEK